MTLTDEERREARRRKILQNSESRLAKILNRTNEIEEKEKTVEGTDRVFFSPVENDLVSSPSLAAVPDTSYSDVEEEILEPAVLESRKENSKVSFEYLRKYFAILAILVYFIIAKGGSNLPSKSILTPFATLSITKQALVYQRLEPTTSMFVQILIIYGVNPRFVVKLSNVVNIFSDILVDFCVYFFTFVLVHFIFETLISS